MSVSLDTNSGHPDGCLFQHASEVNPYDYVRALPKRLGYATVAWREAMGLDPRVEIRVPVTCAAAGRIDDARQSFNEVLRINPGRKDAQMALAQLR